MRLLAAIVGEHINAKIWNCVETGRESQWKKKKKQQLRTSKLKHQQHQQTEIVQTDTSFSEHPVTHCSTVQPTVQNPKTDSYIEKNQQMSPFSFYRLIPAALISISAYVGDRH